jgi:aminoglycoside 3-N-acetyltransferase
MSEEAAIERVGDRPPATATSLTSDLRALGLTDGKDVLVHTSLSALGYICGGPQAVLIALRNAVGPSGTIMMPTFSGSNSEPSFWQSPPVPEAWWPVIRDHMPAFDVRLSPGRQMGLVSETFRRLPTALRSAHPNSSFAADGPRAREFVGEHPSAHSLGDTSPLGRLYDAAGHVLLLGVGHGNNSSLHLAEHRAVWPTKRLVTHGGAVSIDGVRQWQTFEAFSSEEKDFERLGADFEREFAGIRIGTVGAGVGRVFPQRDLVDFAVTWMNTHRS